MGFIEDKQQQIQQLQSQLPALQQRMAAAKKAVDDYNAMMADPTTPGDQKARAAKPTDDRGNIQRQIDNIQNQINTLEGQIQYYQTYRIEDYTGMTGQYQELPKTYTGTRDFEKAYESKQANIGEAQRVLGAIGTATDTTRTDSDIKVQEDTLADLARQRDFLEKRRAELNTKGPQMTPEEWKEYGTMGRQIYDVVQKTTATQNRLNELKGVRARQEQSRQAAQPDIAAAQSVIPEQQKGMDDVRLQRERYMRALQQNRQRSQLYGKSNEYLKALS